MPNHHPLNLTKIQFMISKQQQKMGNEKVNLAREKTYAVPGECLFEKH